MPRPTSLRSRDAAVGARPGVDGRRTRRHGVVEPSDRVALEADGWRTTLDYRENHVRDVNGALEGVETHWRGEAERAGADGRVRVLAVVGPTPARVWRRLRMEAEVLLEFRPCSDTAMR